MCALVQTLLLIRKVTFIEHVHIIILRMTVAKVYSVLTVTVPVMVSAWHPVQFNLAALL